MKSATFYILIAFLLTACVENTFYSQTVSIENNSWAINNQPTFIVEITDTAKSYDFMLHVRNSDSYAYRNIFFFIETTFPNGKIAKDTVECLLADESGKWLGKGKGSAIHHTILFKQNVIFPTKGKYQFKFIHGMYDNPLPHVLDVGLRIDYHAK
jgi:gliding motility-associated lipoprotein GldH